jgi:hypothetical protein
VAGIPVVVGGIGMATAIDMRLHDEPIRVSNETIEAT